MPSSASDNEISAVIRGFAETPGHLIRRAHQAHTQLWAELVPVDITGSQFVILCALTVHGELDQASIGRLTSLDRSSVAELAGRMARRGLIQRGRDERDGRKRVLRITEQGTRAVTEAAPHVLALGQRLLAQLNEAEREQFLAYLGRIGDAGKES
ncbi:MAG: MarR family transcriptional regulator [Streptosporangiaceae bacterium]|jgi:DNA-binding MarR family transcriptional regulator